MRVLLVTHHFLPRHAAGVEVYTDGIARELQSQGHEVAVFTTEDDPRLRPFVVVDEDLNGLSVHRLAHPRTVERPEDTLGLLETRAAFGAFLDRFGPDVVHFQHLMYVGMDAVDEAHARGLPTLMTLHEYWLLCGRGGQLQQASGRLCVAPDRATCARCLSDFRFGRTRTEAKVARLSAAVHRWTGWDPFPFLKGLRDRRTSPKPLSDEPLPADAETDMLHFVDLRVARVKALWGVVDRFLCPSRFLMQKFLDAGWPADRISWSPNGIRTLELDGHGSSDPSAVGVAPGGPLRVGFIGSITPWKGPDVLIRAHARLPAARVTVDVFGSASAWPAFAAEVRRLAASDGVRFHGTFEGGPAAALRRLDVLVVSSTWYENAPLVISEAFAAGVPVVASGHGGMEEMVTDGVDGRLFEPGSDEDLARVLLELADDREQLERLRSGVRPSRTVADDASHLLTLYASLREQLAATGDPPARNRRS